MQHVFISREGYKEFIQGKYHEYSNKLELTLLEMYNRVVDIGIVGVHTQALHIIALHLVFQKRLDKSPISIIDNILIALNSKSELKEYNWQFIV